MGETTERVLRLLGLLQQRPVWTGPELAKRLGVTTRSIRRDVERLRSLGYPVYAAQGVGGGYQLGRGRALPPLLLDDTEAVAVAVSLRMAAGGTVSGASEAALRTLAKLDQVMPPRLRGEVRAIHEATQTLEYGQATVDGDVLLTLARGVRDTVRVRFDYESRDGTPTSRAVEPVGLVAAGRRWYLMAYDVDRDGWRTFRLDRMTSVVTTTWRFRERDHEDPAAYVQRSVASAAYRFQARIVVRAPLREVQERTSVRSVVLTAVDDETTLLEAGSETIHGLAFHLSFLGWEFEVEEPAELRAALAEMGGRAMRAAGAS
jgi:predicted DNA-binding transcriptional regulator YafY